jgi:hypothetical protein
MALTTLRSETADLVKLADRDLARLWRLVAQGASAEVALRDLLPAIVTEYGALGATLAAEWYDDQRDKAGVRGRFTGIPLDAGDRGAQSLVGWALAEATSDESLRSLVLGGVQRRIADHVRYTIAGSSVADPAARGWQRVGAGGCTTGFCDMLIGRGAVYSEATADFAAHDNCRCSAVPAWGGQPLPVKPFKPSQRNVSDADRARVRDWIATH